MVDDSASRGNGTNCIRIVPYSAVQFSSYTIYKKVGREPIDTYPSRYVHADPLSRCLPEKMATWAPFGGCVQELWQE